MTAVPINPFVTYVDTATGLPLVGGKIFSYAAGTSTPKDTYVDALGVTPAANPIILDSAGRSPYGAIWGSGSYKFTLADSSGSPIQTDDNFSALFGAGDMTKAVYDAANIAQQVVGLTAVQTVTNKSLPDSSTLIIDDADPTKKAQFQCSTITTGTTRTYTFPDASGTLVVGGSVPFTLSYTSADQTITSAGTLTLAHGLGAAPKLSALELICQSSEAGFTTADVVPIPTNGTGSQGVIYKTDATNITVRYASSGSAFNILNGTTGTNASLTNANWKLRVKAWA